MFWGDVGAGTSVLIEVDGCQYARVGTGAVDQYGRCQFGAPTLPVLCDCACGD